MEIIHYTLTFLCALSFIFWIIGLIKPKVALFYLKKNQSRLVVTLVYFTLGILFAYLSDGTLTKEMKSEMLELKREHEIQDSITNIQLEQKRIKEEQYKLDNIVTNSEFDGSVSQVKDYLKSNLNDPDSYESIEWSPVSKIKTLNHKFIVRHKYRAKNGFGGLVITNQTFYLDSIGNVVDVVDVVDWK